MRLFRIVTQVFIKILFCLKKYVAKLGTSTSNNNAYNRLINELNDSLYTLDSPIPKSVKYTSIGCKQSLKLNIIKEQPISNIFNNKQKYGKIKVIAHCYHKIYGEYLAAGTTYGRNIIQNVNYTKNSNNAPSSELFDIGDSSSITSSTTSGIIMHLILFIKIYNFVFSKKNKKEK